MKLIVVYHVFVNVPNNNEVLTVVRVALCEYGGLVGRPKYWGKTCPSATLSTTNPVWTHLVSNLGLCDETLATNNLNSMAV